MSQLPSTVRIGHLRYRLVENQAMIDEHGVRNRGDFAGYSHSGTQVIAVGTKSIHSNLPLGQDYKRETVLHEVLHQCLRVAGCDPDQDAKAGVTDVEERAVSAMAGVLLAVLRDNPQLVEFLLVTDG